MFWPNTYFKYIFHVNIQLLVTLKSEQDPNPDRDKKLIPDHRNQ
jgi:hypothetical protein